MQQVASRIKKFTDLEAWKSAHRLRLNIYKATKKFPADEQYGLSSQIRRASVSVASCLAEGFSRQTANDKSHFYTMSLGSLTEVQDQLLLSRDLGYISKGSFENLAGDSVITHKLINGLIKSIKIGKGIKK
jgi:four helix bundle protein